MYSAAAHILLGDIDHAAGDVAVDGQQRGSGQEADCIVDDGCRGSVNVLFHDEQRRHQETVRRSWCCVCWDAKEGQRFAFEESVAGELLHSRRQINAFQACAIAEAIKSAHTVGNYKICYKCSIKI